ncbi:MAG: hypothetical protein CMJ59_24330 [Planctomycetaceae bacterium]|nr:hypothetical protein [Planctomycetaceae bacterium]
MRLRSKQIEINVVGSIWVDCRPGLGRVRTPGQLSVRWFKFAVFEQGPILGRRTEKNHSTRSTQSGALISGPLDEEYACLGTDVLA